MLLNKGDALVGIYLLEPKYFNAAAAKVSTYHKQLGDHVELYNHLNRGEYDHIYAFSLFDFTPKHYVTPEMICGGTGFDLTTKLSDEVEACDYDYSLFPDIDFSWQIFSRGCINTQRKCPFCVVPVAEGKIRPAEPKNLNPRGKYVMVADNNFFANPNWREAIRQLHEWGQPVDFLGVDARILNDKMCGALLSLRHYKQIHIAWDNPRLDLVPKLKWITERIKPWMLMCYVLIGYWSTPAEDLMRVEKLRELGIDPFAMPYNKFDRYQMEFARWVNVKSIFKTVPWNEYKKAPEMYEGQTTLMEA